MIMKKVLYRWKLFEQTHGDSEKIKNLKWGSLTDPKSLKRLGEQPEIIDVDVDKLPRGDFPANDSEEVKKELQQVVREMEKHKNDSRETSKEELQKADQKPLEMFLSFLEKNNIKHDAEFLEDLYRDIARVVVKLKVFYNRPRPEQLGPLLGFDFSAVQTSSDNTPSFPSGHTIQAWTVAHYLSEKNPTHKSGLFDIARNIERSRIKRGAHYPSDNVFSKFLAKHYLFPNIKENS